MCADLFELSSNSRGEGEEREGERQGRFVPLAARMRPRNLDEFVGQTHILGKGQLLRRAIEADRIQSLIFYGPPGTGKTSLAYIIANQTRSRFERLSGVESNVADIRRVLAIAANRLQNTGQPTILFIDEIHRFNKAQQDVLLPDVENGTVRLIGATTHNPFFFVNSPLVSRSQIFELKPLSEQEIIELLNRALKDEERGLGKMKIKVDPQALEHLARVSDGDARKALNSLEIAALTTPPDSDGAIHITLSVAEQCIQKKAVVYDGDEDAHYDTISAFIKSMRGSDPDAALYWLAKMIYAGEDPRFITRRLMICAAEDVGLADPMALVLAVAAHQAAEFVGFPEARIPIAEATIYIATANKSNSAYLAIDAALEDVKSGVTLSVPDHLKDAHYSGAKKIGHGENYKYAHSFEGHFVAQDYLGAFRRYYEPTEQGVEKKIKERVSQWRAKLDEVKLKSQSKKEGK
ncbi:MAG: replication-associated recombination protein A [Verrucomicrobiia bacterium]|jgi:putative ATPase